MNQPRLLDNLKAQFSLAKLLYSPITLVDCSSKPSKRDED